MLLEMISLKEYICVFKLAAKTTSSIKNLTEKYNFLLIKLFYSIQFCLFSTVCPKIYVYVALYKLSNNKIVRAKSQKAVSFSYDEISNAIPKSFEKQVFK